MAGLRDLRLLQEMSLSHPTAAQGLCGSGANLTQGDKVPSVWDMQTPEGLSMEARGTKGYQQSDICSRPPHPILCMCRIPQAFGSTGCSWSTNPMDLKAEHHLGGG